jgi:hypothetical protein
MRQDDITRLREMVAAFNACALALLADPTDPLAIVQLQYLTAKAGKLEQELSARYPSPASQGSIGGPARSESLARQSDDGCCSHRAFPLLAG